GSAARAGGRARGSCAPAGRASAAAAPPPRPRPRRRRWPGWGAAGEEAARPEARAQRGGARPLGLGAAREVVAPVLGHRARLVQVAQVQLLDVIEAGRVDEILVSGYVHRHKPLVHTLFGARGRAPRELTRFDRWVTEHEGPRRAAWVIPPMAPWRRRVPVVSRCRPRSG